MRGNYVDGRSEPGLAPTLAFAVCSDVHLRRLLCCALVALGCARPTPAPPPRATDAERPYVVLVSFDGFRADYLDRLALPNFRRLAAAGVRARAMVPSFPSKTFPNHYTLVTGLYPGDHGIVANAFWDPARAAMFTLKDRAASTDGSWYGGEPIWVTAERQGVRTASVMWPGSEAAIRGVRPSTWMVYDEPLANATRVDSVAAWLRRPVATRPHLVTMYVSLVDNVGHVHGPDAPETHAAVAETDRVLGRLLDSLAVSPVAGHVNVVVVSDHGLLGVDASRVVDLSRWVSLDGVRTADPGPVLSLWFGADSARRDAAYQAIARGLSTFGHARVYRPRETPERWHVRGTSRIGDLLIVGDPGWVVVPDAPKRPPTGANHGWDPATSPEMNAIFLAAGPDIRARGTIAPFPNVDVYPLLAALLRVAPATGLDGDRTLVERVMR